MKQNWSDIQLLC